MSDIQVNIKSGTSYKLLTAGKMCDKDIVITALGGAGALDFSALQYAELTSSSSVVIPDLSVFTNDFSKVVLLAIQTDNAAYLYLKGTDTERTQYAELFYFGPNAIYSTAYDKKGNLYHLSASDMSEIKLYINPNQELTRPFRGKLIMFYEEE